MTTNLKKQCGTLLLLSILIHTQAQDRAQDYNSSRSNKTASIAKMNDWTFGVNSGASFAVRSNESSLFRGNSLATRLYSRYHFGNIGLGFSGGIAPGTINQNALHTFMDERKFQQAEIAQSNPFNSYLMFGPSFRFGNRVLVIAEIQGGMFMNNPGSVSIEQPGALRQLYRFEGAGKNLFPGLSGNISLAYPVNQSTRFVINTDYLHSKSSIRVYDPQRGIDIPVDQERRVKLFSIGAGITKSFGSGRDAGSGMASGKRQRGQAAFANPLINEGKANGERIITGSPTHAINTNAIAAVNDRIMNNENCGPVTQIINHPDGTTETLSFACPNDAAMYNERTNKTVTVPKQTQGTTFGEKVNAGLHAAGSSLSQGTSRGVISGKVTWSANSAAGIITNQHALSAAGNLSGGGGAAAASYAATGRMMPSSTSPTGITTTIYTREAGSGMATGKRSRDNGSGMATGRRQYSPLYHEGETNTCTGCAATIKLVAHEATHIVQQKQAQNNPLYNSSGNQGTNPLFEGKGNLSSGGDDDCDGVAGLTVYLIDINNGAVLANTKTAACGDFFFANVPSASYRVKVAGAVSKTKVYEAVINSEKKVDMAGEITAGDDHWVIELNTDNNIQKPGINTTRSNSDVNFYSKTLQSFIGDMDGDGISEILTGNTFATSNIIGQGASLLGGALPGGSVISAYALPGNPIGGIVVKGGRNPGGSLRTSQTNEHGEFEFTGMEKGTYSIFAELTYYLDDETIVTIGDDEFNNGQNVGARKGWDGSVKGGSKLNATDDNQSSTKKSSAQDYNSSRSNKTASIAGNNPADETTAKSIVNTTKSNTKDFLVTLDELDELLMADKTISASDLRAVKEKSRVLRSSYQKLENSLHNTADAIKMSNEADTNFALLIGSVNLLGQPYHSIAKVLKTKHDTAKNSVGNIR